MLFYITKDFKCGHLGVLAFLENQNPFLFNYVVYNLPFRETILACIIFLNYFHKIRLHAHFYISCTNGCTYV